ARSPPPHPEGPERRQQPGEGCDLVRRDSTDRLSARRASRRGSTRWETIRSALDDNARTFCLVFILLAVNAPQIVARDGSPPGAMVNAGRAAATRGPGLLAGSP